MKKYFKTIMVGLAVFVVVLLYNTTNWFNSTFDQLSLDEIVFHLKVPLKGRNNDFLLDFLKGPFLNSFYFTLVFFISVLISSFVFKVKFTKKRVFIPLIYMFFISNAYAFSSLDAGEYLKNNLIKSSLYNDYYVQPNAEILNFPDNKRNLIYIYLESYESTFTSKKYCGALKNNGLGEMVKLAENNVHFSNNDKIGGAAVATGTTWTVGGMVAQSSGVHLKLPINGNSYGEFEHFLPGVISLGDLLEKEGYNQTLLIGSDADFGGRSNYFRQHGNYDIKDYNYAIARELIPADYREWWGFEDEKLFEFAKDKLLKLASQEAPFNLTMLTADTHHVDGYVTQGMETPFDEQYKNVILNSSQQVFEFITWVQEQDFYDNTTLVVSGDHHTMDAAFIERNVPLDYDRRIYNVIVNSVIEPYKSTNRNFATFDLFPSTLASMGVEIKGDRLGIGTNLFSEKETLFEELGINYVNDELSKRSSYYTNQILKIKD